MTEETWRRKVRAIELRREGKTNREIAAELGVSTTTVTKYLRGEPMTNELSVRGRAEGRLKANSNEARLADAIATAFQLRLKGHPYTEVARKMGVDPRTARKYVEMEIDARVSPNVHALREVETARLDFYLEKLGPAIDGGDVKAIAQAVRIAERRARLLGLDSPVRVEALVTEVTQADIEMQELLNEAELRNAAIEAQIVGEIVTVEAGD